MLKHTQKLIKSNNNNNNNNNKKNNNNEYNNKIKINKRIPEYASAYVTILPWLGSVTLRC